MGKRTSKPLVEIHCKIPDSSELEDRIKKNMKIGFQKKIKSVIGSLEIEIFVWDDFHDRYLISNLGGVSVPNGFDTSNDQRETTWTRLSPDDRDAVQREFDVSSRSRKLRFMFKLP